jgi:hypothetical protein
MTGKLTLLKDEVLKMQEESEDFVGQVSRGKRIGTRVGAEDTKQCRFYPRVSTYSVRRSLCSIMSSLHFSSFYSFIIRSLSR